MLVCLGDATAFSYISIEKYRDAGENSLTCRIWSSNMRVCWPLRSLLSLTTGSSVAVVLCDSLANRLGSGKVPPATAVLVQQLTKS